MKSSSAGKGDKRRQQQIDDEEMERRWQNAFGGNADKDVSRLRTFAVIPAGRCWVGGKTSLWMHNLMDGLLSKRR